MIRRATVDDVPRLVEMGHRFLASSEYAGKIHGTSEHFARTITGVINSNAGAVLVSEHAGLIFGMLGFIVYPHPYSGETVAGEMFWWVEPEMRGRGKELLKAAEDEARTAGAVSMMMIAPNDFIGRLYERSGYSFVESTYQRKLQ